MTTTNNTSYNKQLAEKFLHMVSEGNLEQISEMITPDWTMHGGLAGLPKGIEGLRILFAHLGNIDQKWTIEETIAEGDKVVTRATNTCRQENFIGIDASGVTQTFTAMFMHTIKDGKIDETWRNANDLGRLLQLGVRIGDGTLIDNK